MRHGGTGDRAEQHLDIDRVISRQWIRSASLGVAGARRGRCRTGRPVARAPILQRTTPPPPRDRDRCHRRCPRPSRASPTPAPVAASVEWSGGEGRGEESPCPAPACPTSATPPRPDALMAGSVWFPVVVWVPARPRALLGRCWAVRGSWSVVTYRRPLFGFPHGGGWFLADLYGRFVVVELSMRGCAAGA